MSASISPVVRPGEFTIAAMHLDHAHVYDQCEGLISAGATLSAVFDRDPVRIAEFVRRFPQARVARSEQEILDDKRVALVAAAAIPCERGALGCRVMEHGKDYFTDKAPFTTLEQLKQAKGVAKRTGRKYHAYFGGRLTESYVHAHRLIADGAIGRVVQVIGLGPHRLNAPARAPWFFKKDQYGGIICDIGSHQTDHFLWFTGNTDATVVSSTLGNFANPKISDFDDFGDFNLLGANGATGYHRVDWLTPDGLGTFGDSRTILLGTDGYIELRAEVDIGHKNSGDHLFLVDQRGQQHFELAGTIGIPFYGQLIRDGLDRTETSMSQQLVFKAAELCITAQSMAKRTTAK